MTPLVVVGRGLAAIAAGTLLAELVLMTAGSGRGPRGGWPVTRARRLREAAVAGVLAGAACVSRAGQLLAVSPSPPGGDVRTTTAPGLVGDPLFAVAGVFVVGLVALTVTLAYLRLTAPSRRH